MLVAYWPLLRKGVWRTYQLLEKSMFGSVDYSLLVLWHTYLDKQNNQNNLNILTFFLIIWIFVSVHLIWSQIRKRFITMCVGNAKFSTIYFILFVKVGRAGYKNEKKSKVIWLLILNWWSLSIILSFWSTEKLCGQALLIRKSKSASFIIFYCCFDKHTQIDQIISVFIPILIIWFFGPITFNIIHHSFFLLRCNLIS